MLLSLVVSGGNGAITSLMLMPMLAKYSSVCVEMGAAPVKKNLHWSRPMACLAWAQIRQKEAAETALRRMQESEGRHCTGRRRKALDVDAVTCLDKQFAGDSNAERCGAVAANLLLHLIPCAKHHRSKALEKAASYESMVRLAQATSFFLRPSGICLPTACIPAAEVTRLRDTRL